MPCNLMMALTCFRERLYRQAAFIFILVIGSHWNMCCVVRRLLRWLYICVLVLFSARLLSVSPWPAWSALGCQWKTWAIARICGIHGHHWLLQGELMSMLLLFLLNLLIYCIAWLVTWLLGVYWCRIECCVYAHRSSFYFWHLWISSVARTFQSSNFCSSFHFLLPLLLLFSS